jgi:hypothetical protein
MLIYLSFLLSLNYLHNFAESSRAMACVNASTKRDPDASEPLASQWTPSIDV